jgi:hypothetical protein
VLCRDDELTGFVGREEAEASQAHARATVGEKCHLEEHADTLRIDNLDDTDLHEIKRGGIVEEIHMSGEARMREVDDMYRAQF